MVSNSKCGDENCECEEGADCNCEECGHEQGMQNSMAQFDDETKASIQEIQILEQNFEQLMQQKQLFNMEINETNLALSETEKAEGDIFKLVGGQVIIKTSKEKISAELKHKKELLELRMKSIENQEKEFSERIEDLRSKIMAKISPREN
jgi:prefoldin beta subunit